MTIDPILSPHAPRPLGPYSQAVHAGNLIFVSGQLPLDRDGAVVGPGDIKAQTKAVLTNLSAILEAAGSSLDKVVKTTVFLADLDDFTAMNEVYADVFIPPHPARSTVQVARFPSPILLEIECVALS